MDLTSNTGIEFELYQMKISSSMEVAAKCSHLSPLFLDDALPALCECESEDCSFCSFRLQATVPADAADLTTCKSIIAPQLANSGHVCQCSCHKNIDQSLTHTHIVILSVISQLEHRTPYGALLSEVQDRMCQIIELTCLEYMQALRWLLDEFYIISPLDDDRLQVTQLRRS
ncbi:hypothetical protein P692DRAFT_20874651 [Suillus brevipes Sb2]|nr:hypothetical protein P692DRAFT_20874651 [Suillus brevipes Sb2]